MSDLIKRYDETRNLFIPSEETITQTETQNSNLTFDTPQTDCSWR